MTVKFYFFSYTNKTFLISVIKTYFISKPKKRLKAISPKASSGDLEKEGETENVTVEIEQIGISGASGEGGVSNQCIMVYYILLNIQWQMYLSNSRVF